MATQPAFREAFKRRRCLVPASHYFEWTGEKGAKTKWKFTVVGQEWFCFPGLWDRADTEDKSPSTRTRRPASMSSRTSDSITCG